MILDEKIEITLNVSNIKNYYNKYGNDIKVDQKIIIDINDLSEYSNFKINCKCEICGFENKISKANYTINIKNGGFYCCKKCSRTKFKNTCIEKYGVENVFQLDSIKEKIKDTNLYKYGVDNVLKLEENRIKASNIVRKHNIEETQTPCKYGLKCTRQDCIYSHDNVNMQCMFDQKCNRPDCKYLHTNKNSSAPHTCP